jgi:lipopolysaccharide export system permease protein
MFRYYPTLSRYFLKEIFTYFFLSLIIFVFLFQMAKIFDLTDLIVTHHVSISAILKILAYTIPDFLSYIIPISALLSTLLTFLRVNHDKELIALKAAGINPKAALLPILSGFACFCLILTMSATLIGIPWGSTAAKDISFSLVKQKADIILKPGVFNSLAGKILYVDKIEDGQLQGLFLYSGLENAQNIDYRGEVIVSQKSNIACQENKIIFLLKNGCIWKTQKKGEDLISQLLIYTSYNYVLEIPSYWGEREKNPKEYTPWELWQKIKIYQKQKKDPTRLILGFHEKFSVPVGAFIFVFLGATLGLKEQKEKHISSIGLGLICFTLYQLIFLACENLGKIHILPIHLALWLPTIIFAGITLYLWFRSIND